MNTAMVQAYWQVGRLIVEHEQGAKGRARYGAALHDTLAQRLTVDLGRGFTARNLRHMRAAAEQNWSSRQLERQISVLSDGRKIFAAKYLDYLPTEEQLQRELERERRLLEETERRP